MGGPGRRGGKGRAGERCNRCLVGLRLRPVRQVPTVPTVTRPPDSRRRVALRRLLQVGLAGHVVLAVLVVVSAPRVGVAVALAFGLAWTAVATCLLLVRRTVLEPLERLGLAAARIRSGDLSTTIDPRGVRELHHVGATLDDLLIQLRVLRERHQTQAALEANITRIAELVHQPRSIDAVLERTVRELASTLPAIEVVITLVEGLGGCSHAVWESSGEVHIVHHADQDALDEARLVDAAVSDGDVIAIADVETYDFGDDGSSARALRARQIHAVLVAPVFSGRTPLGAVIVHAGRPGAWPDASHRLVRAVGRELAAAVQYTGAQHREREMLTRLDALDRVQRDFITSVSEELRAPLTTITASLADVDADIGQRMDPDQRRALRVIRIYSERLSAVLEGLLTLSRVESRAATTSFAPVSVAPLIDGVRRYANRLRGDRHLDMRFSEPPGDLMVLGDEAQVHRALANVVDNAVKFTPDGGEISVDVRATGDDRVSFVVSDTGIGMGDDQRIRPFARWLRSRGAADTTRGGIGLEIVRSVVEHHAGELTIASESGAGTTVTLTFPRVGATVSRH